MEPNTVPSSYCHRWISAAMKLGERHYSLFLACGLLVCITCFFAMILPYIGFFLNLLLLFIFFIANMRLTQQVLTSGSATFDDYLKYAFDLRFFRIFSPFLFMVLALAILLWGTQYINAGSFLMFISLLSFVFISILSFAAFMQLNNPNLSWDVALKKVLAGFWQNITTWGLGGLFIGIFAIVSALLCFVPLLLYFVPMTFSVGYLMYASIYEDLDIDRLIVEWSHKSVTTTEVIDSGANKPTTSEE